MSGEKIVRVFVGASAGLDKVKEGVLDLLCQLNRYYRARGVEFVPTCPGEGPEAGDLAVALYWKGFGELAKEGFEAAYEAFKKGGVPKIYVFFREPAPDAEEAFRAFRDSFAERYGHFYCHFETVDSVKFQMAVQSLSLLPGGGEEESLKIEGEKVMLGNESIASLENLPFAKLNSRRRTLQRQAESAEQEVRELEEESAESPKDEDLQDALREARMRRSAIQNELKQHDGFLFGLALRFARESTKEVDERVRKARELFEQGKAREANRLLDLPEMETQAQRNLELFRASQDACVKDIQAFATKAKLVLVDDSLAMTERVAAACRAYDNALRIARKIHFGEEDFAKILFDYGILLQKQNRFGEAIGLYAEALAIRRELAASQPERYEPDVADTLNNIAVLHENTQCLEQAKEEYEEALSLRRKLAMANPGAARSVAGSLNNLAGLCQKIQLWPVAEGMYTEALSIWRKLGEAKPETYEEDEAVVLSNLAVLHEKMQRLPEAEAEHAEALALRRKLAVTNPEAHEPDLAASLNNLAGLYWKTQRFVEAEATHADAVNIYRKLATTNPEAYEPRLAMTLNNLAILHGATKRLSEAEAEYAEVVPIWRRLATAQPDAYEPNLASALYNLADFHRKTQRLPEAEAEFAEALTIRQKLAAANPSAHEAEVVKIFCKSIYLYVKNGQDAEALAMAREALNVCGRCEKRTPGQFGKHMELLGTLIKGLEKKVD